jgi:hypothetical protein
VLFDDASSYSWAEQNVSYHPPVFSISSTPSVPGSLPGKDMH